MIFQWLANRRRKKLRQRPFPEAWRGYIEKNVQAYGHLTPQEQAKLQDDIQVFIAEKNWEGCGGLVLTDEMKATIAAQACLLVLAFENEYFDRVLSILVYPSAYVAPGQSITRAGVVTEGDSHREGEAWYRGPVILSWADALSGGQRSGDGSNLVIHEFAHQLDMLNGRDVDGMPPLPTADRVKQWREVVDKEFAQLEDDCRHRRRPLLDCYGTTNLAEFFAVASECFFERSREMSKRHPELYGIMRDYYGQDPASRTP
ncbi:M90 family metallopeptidase [Lignipirellula cremea]|uniref:Protein MtfA n=1 Tax=Lignipirellula cremea TaxID=2528010 RepID=A0A518E4S5_9BACT|nr:M90 family metallopeptidase [Lignipirellula cremea]QDU99095.1 Protein MtfA [Lignipirellula cremea]